MLLPDFVISGVFKSRKDKAANEDLAKLVAVIEAVLEAFKKIIAQLEDERKAETRLKKVNFRTDDTFN
jgi:hypothetical protein